MLGPITISIPAVHDPAAAVRAVAEHIAAIDALLNGASWESVPAWQTVTDALGCLSDFQSLLGLAAQIEAKRREEMAAEEDERDNAISDFLASERYP